MTGPAGFDFDLIALAAIALLMVAAVGGLWWAGWFDDPDLPVRHHRDIVKEAERHVRIVQIRSSPFDWERD